MGGGRYLQSKSMRLYSLNIKTKGHLLLLKIAWFPSYLMLKSGPYYALHSWRCLLGLKCKWFYSPNIGPVGHAVRMHIAWFLKYSRLESGKAYIKL